MDLPAGVILAGGQSRRMGGDLSKALVNLAGRPMIEHVIQRLRPQVSGLMLSLESHLPEFDGFGLPVVEDRVSNHRGPLTGLYSALELMISQDLADWLLLCPCDAPFLPLDLEEKLSGLAESSAKPVTVIRYEKVVQPTFSLWHQSNLQELKQAVLDRAMGGLMQVLDSIPHAVLDWPEETIPPFFNINQPADREQAEGWLKGGGLC